MAKIDTGIKCKVMNNTHEWQVGNRGTEIHPS